MFRHAVASMRVAEDLSSDTAWRPGGSERPAFSMIHRPSVERVAGSILISPNFPDNDRTGLVAIRWSLEKTTLRCRPSFAALAPIRRRSDQGSDRPQRGTIDTGEGCSVCERHAEEALMASGNSTSKRGFASMDLERQREIASKGGRSVPAEKRSFSQDRELASAAGRKGGQSTGTGRPGDE